MQSQPAVRWSNGVKSPTLKAFKNWTAFPDNALIVPGRFLFELLVANGPLFLAVSARLAQQP